MSTNIILNMVRLPGRLDSGQAATLLGVDIGSIPILIQARLLKPIGNPKPNAIKFFAAVEIDQLAHDRAWLDRAQKAIQQHWAKKNHRIHQSTENKD